MLSDLNKDSGKSLAKGITTVPKTLTHSLMWSVRWAPVLVCFSNLPIWVWKATRSRNVLRTGCCCVFLRTKHMSTPKPLFWRVSDVVNTQGFLVCSRSNAATHYEVNEEGAHPAQRSEQGQLNMEDDWKLSPLRDGLCCVSFVAKRIVWGHKSGPWNFSNL